MPELPEITRLAHQLQDSITGREFTGFEILQPKSLNLPVEVFSSALTGAHVVQVTNRGKWVVIQTNQGWLLLNLGMGGEVLLVDRAHLPEKYRLLIDLDNGKCLSINFWWFGYVHYCPNDGLKSHPMVGKLGPNVLDIELPAFRQIFQGQRGSVKSILLDQSRMAGIGNAYVHDILFLAKLHPNRKAPTLSEEDLDRLFQGIHQVLEDSLKKGTAFYEVDLFGNKGGYTMEDVLIGYREGQPCPVCGTPIEKIKTGSTSSFICPVCQAN